MTRKLDKGDIAEIKERYDGNWMSIRETSKDFGVGITVIRYLVNHLNYQERSKEYSKNWQKANPERAKEMNKKACKKYQIKLKKQLQND